MKNGSYYINNKYVLQILKFDVFFYNIYIIKGERKIVSLLFDRWNSSSRLPIKLLLFDILRGFCIQGETKQSCGSIAVYRRCVKSSFQSAREFKKRVKR